MVEPEGIEILSGNGNRFVLGTEMLEHFTRISAVGENRVERPSDSRVDLLYVDARTAIIQTIIDWYENRGSIPGPDVLIPEVLPFDKEMLFPSNNYLLYLELNDAAVELGASAIQKIIMEIIVDVMAGKSDKDAETILGTRDLSDLHRYMEGRKKSLSTIERKERAAKRAEKAAKESEGTSTMSKSSPKKPPKKGRGQRK